MKRSRAPQFCGARWLTVCCRYALLDALYTLMCGHYGLDTAVGEELHLIDAGLAVPTWPLATIDVLLVDAVVYDVPFILARNLQHAVVGGTVDLFLGALDEDDRPVGYLDGAEG